MIAHISIGVRDIAASRAFYDAVLAALGYRCLYPADDSAGYGDDDAAFWLLQTTQPVPANPKSGLHICFDAPSRTAVDAFHAAALAQGGTDNGKPGLRPNYDADYYAAFVVDPDGYRLEAYYGKG
jgi:catechol 2,3-dioxygenase-like lactoylglutathione lyase family enzyme